MRKKSLAEAKPDLLAQWSPDNELLPSDVSYGSNKKVLWICDKGHSWSATVKNRTIASFTNHKMHVQEILQYAILGKNQYKP